MNDNKYCPQEVFIPLTFKSSVLVLNIICFFFSTENVMLPQKNKKKLTHKTGLQ